ncbi:MAG: alpha/beta hydrolase [Acidobacteria bacterium]|nr:alpha/beta hydrolase [Acidobacteriota bacterium]
MTRGARSGSGTSWMLFAALWVSVVSLSAIGEPIAPKPPGKLVDLGGHRLHVNCSGAGAPVVVVENGLGDFSFDWLLVQERVAKFSRICTYDRAGYAWSDPGPKPRTFAQLNLELHDALEKLGEKGPFVLVGHSYGGPVMINFARSYPNDTAGLVLVDSAHEGMRVGVGGKQTIRLGMNAQSREIPEPHEEMVDADRASLKGGDPPPAKLDRLYKHLPVREQKLQLWAQAQPSVEDAENSQREWSEVYFAQWLAKSNEGSLGKLPLVVLSRAEGGYSEDLDVPAAQMEQERKEGQVKLFRLSTNSRQFIIRSGHNMELEAPEDVTSAIRRVVEAIRTHRDL